MQVKQHFFKDGSHHQALLAVPPRHLPHDLDSTATVLSSACLTTWPVTFYFYLNWHLRKCSPQSKPHPHKYRAIPSPSVITFEGERPAHQPCQEDMDLSYVYVRIRSQNQHVLDNCVSELICSYSREVANESAVWTHGGSGVGGESQKQWVGYISKDLQFAGLSFAWWRNVKTGQAGGLP